MSFFNLAVHFFELSKMSRQYQIDQIFSGLSRKQRLKSQDQAFFFSIHVFFSKSTLATLEALKSEGFVNYQISKTNSKNCELSILFNRVCIDKTFVYPKRFKNKASLSKKGLWKFFNTAGCFILSTPFGILSDRKARLLNVGGIILFYVI